MCRLCACSRENVILQGRHLKLTSVSFDSLSFSMMLTGSNCLSWSVRRAWLPLQWQRLTIPRALTGFDRFDLFLPICTLSSSFPSKFGSQRDGNVADTEQPSRKFAENPISILCEISNNGGFTPTRTSDPLAPLTSLWTLEKEWKQKTVSDVFNYCNSNVLSTLTAMVSFQWADFQHAFPHAVQCSWSRFACKVVHCFESRTIAVQTKCLVPLLVWHAWRKKNYKWDICAQRMKRTSEDLRV